MPNLNTARYTGDEEMPDLSKHNNWMAKVMTPELYKKMRARQTKSGYTIDDVIQTGVDNPGKYPPIKNVRQIQMHFFKSRWNGLNEAGRQEIGISQWEECTFFDQANQKMIICQPQRLSYSHNAPQFGLKIHFLVLPVINSIT